MDTAWNLNQCGRNRLLTLLPKDDYKRIAPHLLQVSLATKEPLFELNRPIQAVYFPLTMVASLITVMQDGTRTDVATVGNEGMVGMPAFFGSETMPLLAFTQVPGEALQLSLPHFRQELNLGGQLRLILNLYAQALLDQMALSVSCNRLHDTEQRCCRWLLMTMDRVGRAEFSLSHEFLGQMLGVDLATVHNVISVLQEKGLVCLARGTLKIHNRPELESTACECYQVVRAEYERLLGGC